MQKIWNKGHRIRASDKHLVYHFSIGTLRRFFKVCVWYVVPDHKRCDKTTERT